MAHYRRIPYLEYDTHIQEIDFTYCSLSCMACWSIRSQYPTSLELLRVDLVDLGNIICSIHVNAPGLCVNYHTFHELYIKLFIPHVLIFFNRISSSVIDIKACLHFKFFAEGV